MKRYVSAAGWEPSWTAWRNWLKERFFRHCRNAEVVRQDLSRELSIEVSRRTVERAVAGYRRLLAAEAKATLRFESPPARQLQARRESRR